MQSGIFFFFMQVNTKEEMYDFLENGSLCRTTEKTSNEGTSSRSDAIFTIVLEQYQTENLFKTSPAANEAQRVAPICPEFIAAKIHFVDLESFERIKAKRRLGKPRDFSNFF